MPCQLDHLSVSVSMDATQQGALAGVVYLALSAALPLCAFTWNTSRTAAIGCARLCKLTEESRDALAALPKTMPATGDAARQVQTVMDNFFHVLQHKYRVYEFFGAEDAPYVVVVARLLLPRSHKLFTQALPATATRAVALLNVAPSAETFRRGLLTQNLQVVLAACTRRSGWTSTRRARRWSAG
ncbi:hypothetical protein PHYPSEUDO_006441 [Phytophthora pseudosyringae]|uniref:Uncharacterized protein n=1 Tax=Phytophthora pseudosyringae TaxID=221518 RepID=A0A8T1VIP0_9STRA|nr:hypothetical protein PHYPSEUDO_006441 [Phytophthora pseudosyringae]